MMKPVLAVFIAALAASPAALADGPHDVVFHDPAPANDSMNLKIRPSQPAPTESAVAGNTDGRPFDGKLTLGTRMTCFFLLDSSSDHILGTITKLDETQDFIPWKLFAEWQFNPTWGVELTWDQFSAKTITSREDHHSDGSYEFKGPILDAVYQVGHYGRFVPYAQLGFAWMLGDFDPEKWWALGYTTEGDWIQMGSTDEPRNKMSREIEVDDALGLVAALGSRIEFSRRWSGDLLLRYMYLESESTFQEYRGTDPIHEADDAQEILFSNLALGLGVAYAF
jgi:hypothetical protein